MALFNLKNLGLSIEGIPSLPGPPSLTASKGINQSFELPPFPLLLLLLPGLLPLFSYSLN